MAQTLFMNRRGTEPYARWCERTGEATPLPTRLPGEAGKPGHLKEDGVTPTEGKTIRLARASLANGGV